MKLRIYYEKLKLLQNNLKIEFYQLIYLFMKMFKIEILLKI